MKRLLLFMSSCSSRGHGGAWRHILFPRKMWRSKEDVSARQTMEWELCLSQCESSSILALSPSQQVFHSLSLCLISLPMKLQSCSAFVLTPPCCDFNPSSGCVVALCLITFVASLKNVLKL